jgi:hypothetical protein
MITSTPVVRGANSLAARFAVGLLFSLLATKGVAAPMSFSIHGGPTQCSGCVIVGADGDISQETPALFEEFVRENVAPDRDTTVVLNSPGGSLGGGIELGRVIRRNNFNTHIAVSGSEAGEVYIPGAGACASSCAYAFLGGVRRSKEIQSLYGLHQLSVDSDSEVSLRQAVRSTQQVIAEVSKYVEDMGASSNIVTLATQTSSDSIDWISDAGLNELGVINSSGLVQQQPWEQLASDSWAVKTILPDGSRNWLWLTCPDKKGYLKFRLTLYKEKPRQSPYSLGYTTVPVTMYVDGVSVAKNDLSMFFMDAPRLMGGPTHTVSGLEVPLSAFQEAASRNRRLRLSIAYPKDFPVSLAAPEHMVPLLGLDDAVKSLVNYCPFF